MLDKIFWMLICIEGAAILPMLIYVLFLENHKSSDHSLALFFVLLPSIALALVSAAYRYTRLPALHAVLFMVPLLFAIPGINAIYNIYGSYVENYQTAYGIGLFDDPGVSALLKAIGKRDEAQVRKLAQTVDVNAVAPERWLQPSPYTPVRFAVERAEVAERDGQHIPESRRMVEVLLALGAKPSSALIYACGSTGTDLTRMLLDAGADANYETRRLLYGNRTARDLPFYGCADSPDSALGNLELLASHGARFVVLEEGAARPMRRALLNHRWDQVVFLYDRGLPMEADSGVRSEIEEAVRRTGNPGPQLSRVRELVGLDR